MANERFYVMEGIHSKLLMMYMSTMEDLYLTAVAKNTEQSLRSSADASLPLFCKIPGRCVH